MGVSQFNRETEKFIQYKHAQNNSNTISDDLVNCVLLDRNGILWIGTEEHGLDSYNIKTKTFTHYTHDPNNPNSLGENSIKSLLEDSQQKPFG